MLRAFRLRGLLDENVVADMLSWQANGGFSVDASVRVEGEDRARVERLVRYCARGPLALERLHALGGQEALSSPGARLLYRHLDLPHRPPPIAPARGPPQAELDLDQTPAFDPSDPEPAPDFDFDQFLPDGLDD